MPKFSNHSHRLSRSRSGFREQKSWSTLKDRILSPGAGQDKGSPIVHVGSTSLYYHRLQLEGSFLILPIDRPETHATMLHLTVEQLESKIYVLLVVLQ